MGIGVLADVGEGVDLAEALEELEFDMDDVGQAAARLQARTDRLILRGSPGRHSRVRLGCPDVRR
jgi:hypothetical protein